jgi:hypothetical protein
MKREYKRNTTEYYVDENRTDIYVYSTYMSANGNQMQTFLDEKNSCRSSSLENIIGDLIRQGAKIFRVIDDLENYQVGDNVIYLKDEKWSKENIKRDFKYKSIWDEYRCDLFINPKKYRFHLEYETFKPNKFMSVKLDTYNITLYDRINVCYHWRENIVEVIKSLPVLDRSGRQTYNYYNSFYSTVEKKEFFEDKIKAINYYYTIYEHYKNECLPDIIEHIL